MEDCNSWLRSGIFKYEQCRKETSAGGLYWNKCRTARRSAYLKPHKELLTSEYKGIYETKLDFDEITTI
jgi:hypothetical protein